MKKPILLLILTFVIGCLQAQRNNTMRDFGAEMDTIRIVGFLITPTQDLMSAQQNQEILIAEYQVLEVLKGVVPHNTVNVGYFSYTLQEQLPERVELTLFQSVSDTGLTNYYIFPNNDASQGIKYIDQ